MLWLPLRSQYIIDCLRGQWIPNHNPKHRCSSDVLGFQHNNDSNRHCRCRSSWAASALLSPKRISGSWPTLHGTLLVYYLIYCRHAITLLMRLIQHGHYLPSDNLPLSLTASTNIIVTDITNSSFLWSRRHYLQRYRSRVPSEKFYDNFGDKNLQIIPQKCDKPNQELHFWGVSTKSCQALPKQTEF